MDEMRPKCQDQDHMALEQDVWDQDHHAKF